MLTEKKRKCYHPASRRDTLDIEAYTPPQDRVSLTTACMSKVGEGAIMDEMLCAGYVEGIADLLSEDAICVPPEIAGKQLIEITMQYAEKHQEMLHQPASRFVANALKAKYSCR
jgi:hypothetical protein